jgi:hypothetical protein
MGGEGIVNLTPICAESSRRGGCRGCFAGIFCPQMGELSPIRFQNTPSVEGISSCTHEVDNAIPMLLANRLNPNSYAGIGHDKANVLGSSGQFANNIRPFMRARG